MQTDKEALTEFARGTSFVIVVTGFILLLILTFGVSDIWDDSPPTKFEVVDKYEQCDVVRYTDKTNRWHYFLHCPNQ